MTRGGRFIPISGYGDHHRHEQHGREGAEGPNQLAAGAQVVGQFEIEPFLWKTWG